MGRAGRRARLAGLEAQAPSCAIAAGVGVAAVATAGIAVWALLVVPARDAIVKRADQSAPSIAAAPHRDAPMRFADGSTAVPWGGPRSIAGRRRGRPGADRRRPGHRGLRPHTSSHDQERVFLVRASKVTVTVLGTAFSVERVADRVGVTVTRGAVQVDWGVGARRMAAGDDGWFPPLVVSPPAGDEPAEVPAKEARPVRHKRERVDDGAATPAPIRPSRRRSRRQSLLSRRTRRGGADGRRRPRAAGGTLRGGRRVASAPDSRTSWRPAGAAAAFSLGRVLLGELRRPAEAAQAFARARKLAPDGPLAEDALAREVEAWARAGNLIGPGRVEPNICARTRTEPGRRT